ncbi:hypothetical protein CRG98_043416 [Punica granatum]|uniref:Uncharacterized protein n=1 Tax=Punica granatum TaxID=22663 RepID=A0A2I0HX56_PUNGR|nr:hypothetical protein CRG98_043416 [Punica granatum]
MSLLVLILITSLLSALVYFVFFSNGSRTREMNLPRGSMGYPVIGETLSFLKAQAKDEGPSWFEERIAEHGPVFKTSLMGSPTVVIMGQAGNKFIFTAREDVLVPQQPLTLRTIAGKQNISELSGSRRVIFIPLFRDISKSD